MSARGFMTPEKLVLHDDEQVFSPTVHIVPPHSTTHLDVYYSHKNDAWADPYVKLIDLPALVLDLSDKATQLERYLIQTDDPFELPIPMIDEKYRTPEKLREILSMLQINKDELETTFGLNDRDISGRFLIFHTEWDRFQRTRQSLNNRFLELRHAYLCHPFLSLKTARYLADKGIAGIASDVMVLENPIIYAAHRQDSSSDEKGSSNSWQVRDLLGIEEYKHYLNEMRRTRDIPGRAIFMQNNNEFYYLKRIRGLEKLINQQEKKENTVSGTIFITPLTSILPRKPDEMRCHCDDYYDLDRQIVLGLTSEVVFIPEQK